MNWYNWLLLTETGDFLTCMWDLMSLHRGYRYMPRASPEQLLRNYSFLADVWDHHFVLGSHQFSDHGQARQFEKHCVTP